ncbi:MAG: osmotically inducible protein OsmC [Bacteroidetes bacterium]|jgi:ribosomal protein S12 methylthiotransferase accessory factor|nr:osmotically inducible protein OsmC [Bacteroidota bacterium]
MNMEITFEAEKIVTAKYNGHSIKTDQPLDNGGLNSAPAPFDLYLASIGTCTGIYVKSFCDKRNIPTENIKILLETLYDEESGLPLNIKLDIKLPQDFPEKYKSSLIQVAGLCKVKKSILSPPSFEIVTSVGTRAELYTS